MLRPAPAAARHWSSYLCSLSPLQNGWTQKRRANDSVSYLIAACAVAVVSLLYLTQYGFNLPGDPHWLWLFYLLYALGAFWLARRRVLAVFGWIGSALLLVSLFHALGPWLGRSFPWQTAILLHAGVCALIAIIASRYCEFTKRSITRPLNSSALITSFAALLCLLQANQWETTGMQAERVFWIAGIWFALLWLNRDWRLFTVFQIGLTGALVLAIKAALQQYDWYAYLPHAFLHPTALQIQGTALVLLSLAWVGVRFALSDKLKFVDPLDVGTPVNQAVSDSKAVNSTSEHWTSAARRLLKLNFAFDRLVIWAVLGAFALLVIYGAFSGVRQELTAFGSATPVWDVVGFPHQEALGSRFVDPAWPAGHRHAGKPVGTATRGLSAGRCRCSRPDLSAAGGKMGSTGCHGVSLALARGDLFWS